MKKILLIIFSTLIIASELSIDMSTLEKYISKNPNDIKTLNLAGIYYYKKHNLNKSEFYFKKVLSINKNNKISNKYLALIKSKKLIRKLFEQYNTNNLNKLVDALYGEQKYKELLTVYPSFDTSQLNKESIVKVARVLMWEGQYKNSLKLLRIHKFDTIDYYEIYAYDYFYMGKYKKAKKYFETLYFASGDKKYAIKLLDIYQYLGEYNKMKKVIYSLKRRGVSVAKYEKIYEEFKNKAINKLLKNYKNNPTYNNLISLFWYYYSNNQKDQALELLKDFTTKHPSDEKAKLFYAKVLSWEGKYNEAKKIALELQNNIEAKLLLGKLYAWNGEFKKAESLFWEVYKLGNKKQKYNAKKMIATIYLWQSKNKLAKPMFEDLLKNNPDDQDVKESLMIINKNFQPLIKKYEKLLKKEPENEEYILKLADFYQAVGNIDKAIWYNEKYIHIHPENIERYKILGDLYLKKKNFYKAFGNLEYWAEIKNTKEAKLLLAKSYYWYGFNNEALKVLDEILKSYPNFKKALLLKAKILKINPKFVMSKSAATIDDYFNNRANKLLALADRAYFASFYKNASTYYNKYISLIPDDYKTREKYAYSLEYAKDYSNAAGEFYQLLWMENNPIYKYHIAYNLQQTGKINKAKKIYKELLKEIPKKLPKSLKIFLNNWKKAWESMDIDKYYSFYDHKYFSKFWKLRKEALFRKAGFISVGIYDPLLTISKKNIYKIKFFQVYASKVKNDSGYKVLTLKCNKDNCKIIKETWKKSKYIPYKENESLYFFINRNLKQLEKQAPANTKPKNSKINVEKLIDNYRKNEKPDKEKNKVYDSNITKSKVDLAPGIKKINEGSESEILNTSYLEKVKKKDYLISEYKEKNINPDYLSYALGNNRIYVDSGYFQDNQNTSMYNYLIGYEHKVSGLYIGPFYSYYAIKQESDKKNGNYYGISIRKNNENYISLFYDSTLKTLGTDISFLKYDYNIKLSRKNLAYTRKSLLSTKYISNKVSISKYKSLDSKRGLWYYLAYEKIGSNSVITPQFDYEFYNFNTKYGNIILALSGWYQFNSKPTNDYYSPEKIDNNLLGLRFSKEIYNKNYLKINANGGYSFWDNVFLYGYGAWIYKNTDSFNYKIGCNFGNTSSANSAKGYKSTECRLSIGKLW